MIREFRSVCKMFINSKFKSVNFVFIWTGGNGYTNDYPVGRHLRDAKLFEIGAGTSEVRRLVVAREVAKLYTNAPRASISQQQASSA